MRNEKIQAYGLLLLAVGLIGVKGFGSGQGFFTSVAHSYIEETSASVSESIEPQLADISDLSALNGQPTPQPSVSASFVQDNTIQASDPASTDYLDSFKPDQVVQYTVQPGDSIGFIASDFNVSVNTIIWANNLKNPDKLSVGQVLKIPPVTGVIYTVKASDTVASIAKKYKADAAKIVAFNQLPADQSLKVGDELMLPDGEMPGPVPVVKSTVTIGTQTYKPVGDGQCVAFVQAHGFANLHGNAYQWAAYSNTSIPRAGEVVVLKGGKFGHVALITAVKDDSIQIVEQNYYGPYVIDHREISFNNRSIVGYIR